MQTKWTEIVIVITASIDALWFSNWHLQQNRCYGVQQSNWEFVAASFAIFSQRTVRLEKNRLLPERPNPAGIHAPAFVSQVLMWLSTGKFPSRSTTTSILSARVPTWWASCANTWPQAGAGFGKRRKSNCAGSWWTRPAQPAQLVDDLCGWIET